MIAVHKTPFVIGSASGIMVELRREGQRIASAELMLPGHDADIDECVGSLMRQCISQGIRISGRQKMALFEQIEMGAVT